MRAYERLEVELAHWMNASATHVVACNSGTAALHLAFEALRPSDRRGRRGECIVPDFTMVACPRAVQLADMTPVFVDCDAERLLMRPTLVSAAVTSRTEFIMAVHVYGRRCDMDALVQRAHFNDCLLIEDLAEAHGVPPDPRCAASCWSFYRNKIIAGEEGGAVLFASAVAAQRARSLRSLGFTEAHDFQHVPRGHNYRLADALAVQILQSLRHFDWNIAARREIEAMYDAHCPAEWRMPARDAVWVYDVRVPGMTHAIQDIVVARLRDIGLEARHAFKPMSRQPEWTNGRSCVWLEMETGRASDVAAREVIYLPCDPGRVSEQHCKLAFDVIKNVLIQARKGVAGLRLI